MKRTLEGHLVCPSFRQVRTFITAWRECLLILQTSWAADLTSSLVIANVNHPLLVGNSSEGHLISSDWSLFPFPLSESSGMTNNFREMGLKEVVGIKLLEQGLAQNRLSKYISCHNNCHDWHCSLRHQGFVSLVIRNGR